MKTRTAIAATVAAGLAGASGRAHALPQPYQFSGTVTSVPPPLSSQFSVGDPLTGRVTVETVPGATDNTVGWAQFIAYGFTAEFGSGYSLTSNDGALSILDNSGFHGVNLGFTAPGGLVGPIIDGHYPDYISLYLIYDAPIGSSTTLPSHFVPATLVDQSNLRFDVNASLEVRFMITDFSAVPEPVAAGLIAGGAAMIPRRRRR